MSPASSFFLGKAIGIFLLIWSAGSTTRSSGSSRPMRPIWPKGPECAKAAKFQNIRERLVLC